MRRAGSRIVRHALGEILIVTLGILLAFALDAAWDNYRDARRERAHLQALADDFQRNVELLQEAIATEEGIITSGERLLQIIQRGDADPQAGLLVSQVFTSQQYEPVLGAYEELVGAGGLTIISDQSLRSALADFSAQARGKYSERFSEQLYLSFIQEFLGRQLLFTKLFTDRQPDMTTFGEARFQEYLLLRTLTERDLVVDYRRLLQLAQSILGKCRKQLDS